MKSGYSVIKELGKYGLRGSYFSHEQYITLSKIKDFSEVKEKIAEWGYPDVAKTENASEIVNILKKTTTKESITSEDLEQGCLTALILEPFFWLLLLFTGC